MNVKELAHRTVDAMVNYGLTPISAWYEYSSVYTPIIKLHEAEGLMQFSRKIVTEYVAQVESRLERGEIKMVRYRHLKRGAQRLTEMHDTGKLEWSAPKKASGFVLNPYYEKIIAKFVDAEDVSLKTKSDITWVCRKYFSWLIWEGHGNLRKVKVDEVQRFMIYCSRQMTSGSIHNVKLYMKKLYSYLADNGHSKQDYAGLLSFNVVRGKKIFPALSKDEIAMIMEIINKRTPKGKRDYAIILLSLVTGLRACDVVRLKLGDIDWRRGEIKISQSKTHRSLALPLTEDVGKAIEDYILNGRQQSESDTVFLSMHAPHPALSNGVAIGDMYDYYRKRAGLPRDAHDGKGFHALRRTLGKSMVTSGIPVTMVAQILGQEDIDSTKQYIALDSEHLKECALDFADIEVAGRGVSQ